MADKINNSIEEKFLIKILFTSETVEKKNTKDICFDKLVKVSSEYLMLPALYLNLKKKNKLDLLPVKLVDYLKEIYELNLSRNKCLIRELNEIIDFFNNKGFRYLFLKGSYMFLEKIYSDIGERMIGDIDFLFEKNKKSKVVNILNENGYHNSHNYKFWKTKHLRRFIKKNKLFAVEPHTETLIYRKKHLLTGKKMLESSGNNGELLIKHCILNYQINDYGHLKASYSLRSYYDIFKLTNIYEFDSDFLNNKYLRRYFLISNLLNITNLKIKKTLLDQIYIKRFLIKNEYYFFYKIDEYLCRIIIIMPKLIMQLVELIFNPEYRKRVFKKLY